MLDARLPGLLAAPLIWRASRTEKGDEALGADAGLFGTHDSVHLDAMLLLSTLSI